MSGPDDVVRPFPRAAGDIPENPLTIAPRHGPNAYCQHEAATLDVHSRMVICRACGATLEPFGFLLHNAQTLARAWADHRSVSAALAELRKRVEELRTEETRLRARVKRARESANATGPTIERKPTL